MKSQSKISICALAIGIVVQSIAPSQAVADSIPFTQSLFVYHSPDVASPDYYGVQRELSSENGGVAPTATTTAYSGSGEWGSISGSASADLATGQLKVRATETDVDAAGGLYTQANASFGDSFTTTDSTGSFNWLPDSTAHFSITVDGSLTATPSLQESNAGGFALLSIWQHGTLDPNENQAAGSNLIGYYLFLFGNADQNLTSCDFNGNCVNLLPTAFLGDLSSPITVTQDFQPGGDFDFSLLLGAAGSSSDPSSFDLDLSHTLTFAYQGPNGTTTTSASGLFNNFSVATPEPGSMALLLTGVAAVLKRRRSKIG